MVGAPAGGFDLGSRPLRRRLEPVVVVRVAADPRIGPAQGGQVDEARGLRPAVAHQPLSVAPAQAGDAGRRARVGEGGDHLLALAHHDDVGVELAQCRLGRGGAVRTDRDAHAAAMPERVEEGARHAQLGRSATPEQVCGGGRDDRHVGGERRHLVGGLPGGVAEERVDEQRLMASAFEQRLGVRELERQVRLATAEIDAAIIVPGGLTSATLIARPPAWERRRDCRPRRGSTPPARRTGERGPRATRAVGEVERSVDATPVGDEVALVAGPPVGMADRDLTVEQPFDAADQLQEADRVRRSAAEIEGVPADAADGRARARRPRPRPRRRGCRGPGRRPRRSKAAGPAAR